MSLSSQCNTEITTKYVKCYLCNSHYHFSPCCSLSEKTYATVASDRRAEWRCHRCKTRKASTSSNNSYHIIIEDRSQTNQQKQQRDEEVDDNESSKRFKNSPSLNDVNNSVCLVKNDVNEIRADVSTLKTGIDDIKNTIQQLATATNQNTQISTNVETALNAITNTLATLTSQVNNLCEMNKEKDKQIQDMNKRINNLEQQLISKNIEIKNVPNENLLPNDVIKLIAASVNVDIDNNDISNSYYLKKSQKIIVEFTTLNKKRELMGNIKRHRVDSKVVTGNTDNNSVIYINDLLTAQKRQLLWSAKTKAKESNWKFVWVKNGNIYAKKNEISNPIIINNTSDIELITSAI